MESQKIRNPFVVGRYVSDHYFCAVGLGYDRKIKMPTPALCHKKVVILWQNQEV